MLLAVLFTMNISWGMVGGIVGATYASASLILWRFPSLIYRKKTFKFPTLHCSHRGGAAENLENTMGAFRHAVNMGTDMLELDCQLTKDGKVVVLHEPNLLRLTGEDKDCTDLLYKDLPLLKPKLWLHFDKDHIASGSDRKIALLEDVFKEFPSVVVNIDLKEGDDKLILEVDRLIRKYKREELCIWGNRSEKIAQKCFEINPNVPMLCSFQKVFYILASFYLGFLPFLPLREGFLEIPYSSVYFDIMPPAVSIYDKFIRIAIVILDWLLFNRFLISHLDRRGIRVIVWVLQKPEHFDFALSKGVHGIMTDYPARLMNYLASKNLRQPSLEQTTRVTRSSANRRKKSE